MLKFLYVTVFFMLLYVGYRIFRPFVRKRMARRRLRRYHHKAIGTVTGEIKEYRTSWLMRSSGELLPQSAEENGRSWSVYSPIVSYTLDGMIYEIDAQDYTLQHPVLGRKAMVFYDDAKPEKAAVYNMHPYKKHLKITAVDEQYAYCSCGFKRNISILRNELPERAVPGRYLVFRYGFYDLEQPEDYKKTLLDGMETIASAGSVPGMSEYVENK